MRWINVHFEASIEYIWTNFMYGTENRDDVK